MSVFTEETAIEILATEILKDKAAVEILAIEILKEKILKDKSNKQDKSHVLSLHQVIHNWALRSQQDFSCILYLPMKDTCQTSDFSMMWIKDT